MLFTIEFIMQAKTEHAMLIHCLVGNKRRHR